MSRVEPSQIEDDELNDTILHVPNKQTKKHKDENDNI